MKIRIMVITIALVLLASGCRSASRRAQFQAEGSSAPASSRESSGVAKEAANETVCVYVCGEVACPGVYELPSGSRVRDVIVQAGGLKEEADAEAINQASVLKDQEKIVVPSVNEASAGTGSDPSGLLDVNSATKEQLMALPGIGESRAAAIISYREKNNGFRSVEDLLKVEGIKAGIYNKIKDSISVS